MRRTLLTLVLAFAVVPAVGQARNRTIAPPGNSGVGQYVESIPTAGGSRPTNTVHPLGGGSNSGGSHGGGSNSLGSPGGGSGSGGSHRGSSGSGGSRADGSGSGNSHGATSSGQGSVSAAGAPAPAPERALGSRGPDGAAAAALAQETAPAVPVDSAHARRTQADSPRGGSSPIATVVKAVTGSSSGGGLGPVLPIILVATVLGGAALALLRRRRTT